MSQKRERQDTRTSAEDKRPESERPERVPLHEQRDIMTAPGVEGWIRRWVNEEDRFGPRIPRFQKAGWRVVTENLPVGHEAVVSHDSSLGSVLRKHVGKGQYAILMEIQKDFYDEDQLKKGYLNDKYEDSIKRTLDGSREGVYGETTQTVTRGSNVGHKF